VAGVGTHCPNMDAHHSDAASCSATDMVSEKVLAIVKRREIYEAYKASRAGCCERDYHLLRNLSSSSNSDSCYYPEVLGR